MKGVLLGFHLRSTRRSSVAMAVVVGAMLLAGEQAWRTARSSGIESLNLLTDNPAVRALYGTAHGLASSGEFTTWRMQTFLQLAIAIWAVATTTRLTRGDEEAGRTEILLSTGVSRRNNMMSVLTTMTINGLAFALVAALVLSAYGEAILPSICVAVQVWGVAATFSALGSLAAQLFHTRAQAFGASTACVCAAMLLRALADSVSGLGWLSWLSPFGWAQRIEPFTANRTHMSITFVLAWFGLCAVGAHAATHRDMGNGLFVHRLRVGRRMPRVNTPVQLLIRERGQALIGWTSGALAFGLILGSLTNALTDYLAADPRLSELMDRAGIHNLGSAQGYIAMMNAFASLIMVGAILGAVRTFEEDLRYGRHELALSGRHTRSRWYGALFAATALSAIVLAGALTFATWLGCRISGAPLDIADAIGAGTIFGPIGILTIGAGLAISAVRIGIAGPIIVSYLTIAYLTTTMGALVGIPQIWLDMSIFTHLNVSSGGAIASAPLIASITIGLVCTMIGWGRFTRSDLSPT
jgi:ABC-2 type transport system permease protein